jgi:hypothetical protein
MPSRLRDSVPTVLLGVVATGVAGGHGPVVRGHGLCRIRVQGYDP